MDDNKNMLLSGKSRLQNFLSDEGSDFGHNSSSQPIADLFPFCTVFFGDIAGFTAYSSTREPSQVFVLLETIYQVFDALAKRRGVFKVETMSVSLTKARCFSHAVVFFARKRRHLCGRIGFAQSR
jgi:hypothetical protein